MGDVMALRSHLVGITLASFFMMLVRLDAFLGQKANA